MPGIGDFIRQSWRPAKIAIAALGTHGDFMCRRSAHKIARCVAGLRESTCFPSLCHGLNPGQGIIKVELFLLLLSGFTALLSAGCLKMFPHFNSVLMVLQCDAPNRGHLTNFFYKLAN